MRVVGMKQVKSTVTPVATRWAASGTTIPRRRFLTLCALGALPGLLSACFGEPSGVGHAATPRPRPFPRPSPTIAPPTEANWSSLAANMRGTLVRPGDSQYVAASQLYDPRFDGARPLAVAYCATPSDVQLCLAYVSRFGLPVAPRAGGHSYGGYSTTTGVVLDVTRMNAVSVDATTGVARVGAGARLIDVYAALAAQGLALPAGSCPTVGIAGLALGGGLGVLDRKFGLTCDNLLSADIVTADGRLLTCSAGEESDLFWALRGGGGGNFGVVTQFTFKVYPVSVLSLFTLDWPWTSAAALVDAWQHWAPQAPDELWSNCLLFTTSDRRALPVARVNGVYVGDVADLSALLGQLSNQMGAAPSSSYVSEAGLLETMLIEANCGGQTVSECHLQSQNPQGQLARETFGARSDYYASPLPRQGINDLISAIGSRQASSELGYGIIGLDACGGAINRVDPATTAFVHRDALFSAQYYANWNAGDPDTVVEANQAWLRDTWQAMRPYVSGEVYQNYLDPDLPNWLQAYYGSNLPRLQAVKAAYDPGNLFHFDQSIPPAHSG
jgi:FAD/FMN-containing dehydrogenase